MTFKSKNLQEKKTLWASQNLVELSWPPHVSSFPCRCTDFLPHLKDWLIAIVKKWLFVSVCQPCDELVTHYQLESAPAGPTRDELKLRPTKLSTCIYDGLTLLRINITYTSHSSKTQGLLVKTQQTFPVIQTVKSSHECCRRVGTIDLIQFSRNRIDRIEQKKKEEADDSKCSNICRYY